MTEVIAARSFPGLFPLLDIAWLLVLAGIMLASRRRMAVLVGLAGGVVYQIVDYGIFHLALGTRVVTGGDPFWVLLWMSMSYGFTNMALAWLWLDNDGKRLEWTLLVVAGWIGVAFAAQQWGAGWPAITTSRGTSGYHGAMAVILLGGYAILCVRNIRGRNAPAPIPALLAIGIGVQFAWEAVLLLAGIRPVGWQALVVNSLIETNLGMPWLWMIHRAVSRRWREDLRAHQGRGLGGGQPPARG